MPPMASHQAVESLVQGYPAQTLISDEAELEVSFVPTVGMVGASMLHHSAELLGQRGGLARYEATRSTMGIPLLHPWANRLAGWTYTLGDRRVEIDPDSAVVKTDPNDLPIHGFLGASPYWEVLGAGADDTSARLAARMDFAAHPEYLEGFPFPHELRIDATLADSTLTIRTTLAATGDLPVPVSFGFHPYFTLPGVDRADWQVELPVTERVVTDDRQIPTGATEPVAVEAGPLGDRTFDDGYANVPDGARFALAGGGRRIAVEWVSGYRHAQVYAPDGDDLIAFEPMTAPTNALVSGNGLELVPPGESRSATFSVTVESV